MSYLYQELNITMAATDDIFSSIIKNSASNPFPTSKLLPEKIRMYSNVADFANQLNDINKKIRVHDLYINNKYNIPFEVYFKLVTGFKNGAFSFGNGTYIQFFEATVEVNFLLLEYYYIDYVFIVSYESRKSRKELRG